MEYSLLQEDVKFLLSCLQVYIIVCIVTVENTYVWFPLLPLKMVVKLPLAFAGVKFSQNRAH